MNKLASILFHSRTQAHVFHLRVKGKGSFAAHLALQTYYEGIIPLIDGLVESYQGYHGRIDFGNSCELISFSDVEPNSWLKTMMECLTTLRENVKESDLQNLIDELIADVSKLMYLLTLK